MLHAPSTDRILTIDIGGTFVKATILNDAGELQEEYRKIETPKECTPKKLIDVIKALVSEFENFNRISVGFPGYVKKGVVFTCPQLGTEVFAGFNVTKSLRDEFNLPVRMVNDADLQGLGVASGVGFEMLITLGTGLGSALLFDGTLLPHLELSQHPVTGKYIYDHYIGAKTLDKIGIEKWNKRVKKILHVIKTVFNYDHLYIGGGNSSKINFPLNENVTIVTNQDGIKGGAKLWQMTEHPDFHSIALTTDNPTTTI